MPPPKPNQRPPRPAFAVSPNNLAVSLGTYRTSTKPIPRLPPHEQAVRSIDAKYRAFASDLGEPRSDYVDSTRGTYRLYERGLILHNGKRSFAVYGEIYRRYNELGGVMSDLGAPTSDEFDSNGGWQRQSNFTWALIAWVPGVTQVFGIAGISRISFDPGIIVQDTFEAFVTGIGFTGGGRIQIFTEGFGAADRHARASIISRPDGTFRASFWEQVPGGRSPFTFSVRVEDPDSDIVSWSNPVYF